jgi:hypothetical protein
VPDALNQTFKTATEPAFNPVNPYQETKVSSYNEGAQVVIDDGDENILAQQDIQFTNFPLNEITLFACWNGQFWVIMLTSEY